MQAANELHVIFGTGPLGMAVMHALVRRGLRVKMVNRSGRAPKGTPAEVTVDAGDASDRDIARQLCAGAVVVYQCANPPYDQWIEKFPPLQAGILEGAASANAKLIVGENLYMYGPVEGPLHEDLPYAADTPKGRLRAELAEAVLEAHRSGKVRTASGRASDFYGPRVLYSTLGEMALVPALQGKTARLIGSLDQPHTYSYIEDCGEALAILGERDEALGEAWHLPSPPTLTQGELMTLFFEEIDEPPKMRGMGKWMMRIGALFIPEARESLENMYMFERPFVVDHSKFAEAFGDIAAPHRQAVSKTVAWYRQRIQDSG